MARKPPYAGPSDTNDFDGLSPDQMARALHEYRLLGDCFEDATDEEMMGRGFLIEEPLDLIAAKFKQEKKARRELLAAIQLAHYKGNDWREIGTAVGMNEAEARGIYKDAAHQTPEQGSG